MPEGGSISGPDAAAGNAPTAGSLPADKRTTGEGAKTPPPELTAPVETPPKSPVPTVGEESPAAPMPADRNRPAVESSGAQPPVPAAASGAKSGPGAAAPDATGAPTLVAAEAVGSLATDVELLLRLDRKNISETNPASQAWQRVSSREFLYPGDELVVLPTFRTNVVLSSGGGVKAQILGGAALTLEAPDEQGVPGIRITEGRLIMMPTGKPGSQVRLLAGQLQGALVFGDTDATAAIEVRRGLPDGADPATVPAQVTVDLYVPAGVVTWVSATGVPATGVPAAGGTEDTVKAPGRRTLTTAAQRFEPVAAAAKDFPEWISGVGPGAAEKRTADEVEKELEIGKPVHLRLKEIAFRDRRVEFKSLAARCLFQLGDFETFLPLLSDPNQKSYWTTQIEAVRASMARSPKTAAELEKVIASQRDLKTAEELYRMLWGYSREELRKVAAARLVDELDHQDLDVRVLSFWNLYHVTGFTLNYRPQDVQAKRQQSVRAWKQKLDGDLIVPR